MSRLSVSSAGESRCFRFFGIRAALFSCLFAAWVFGARAEGVSGARPETVLEAITKEVQAVFEQRQSAVVRIQAVDEHGRLSGSGFYVDPNGTIFTSYTLGGDTKDIVVCSGTTLLPAERILGDARSGIAILKVNARTPFLAVGKSAELAIASPVMLIGYPMDLPATPKFGTVGGFDEKYQGRYFSPAYIRANMPVERGEGGAPLLNLKGEVVGILVSPLENGGGCFALPIEAAEKVYGDFMRFGEARPGWLGITVGDTQHNGQGPPVVRAIFEDSPAAKCGLQTGDILLRIGERKIQAPEDVLDACFYLTAGDPVALVVSREGKETTLQAQAMGIPSPRDALKILKEFESAHPGVTPVETLPGVSPVETIWKAEIK
jgi:S1-C subfamily serine protease